MPSSPADNAIMTIGEVADYLKVTERTASLPDSSIITMSAPLYFG